MSALCESEGYGINCHAVLPRAILHSVWLGGNVALQHFDYHCWVLCMAGILQHVC